ncbi:pyridoxal phosphate-dependent transferase [Lactarius deliciosus]|nr:pyridoxal phosphate-dependent transferase [Lactarius deliciosus]
MASPSQLVVPIEGRDAHDAACAWFLGPKAENADCFMTSVETILNDVIQCRRNFSSEDDKSMSKLKTTLTLLSRLLPQHCVPFYSPRYMAHMVADVSMPATLGYIMGLMYNPNNVGAEGGPITHVIEHDVGQQLCSMLGFHTQLGDKPQQGRPTAWGHITCGGSIANLESMCIITPYLHKLWTYSCTARNLKFYPLALKRAVDNESSLAHVAAHFRVRLCTGKEKVFAECDAWELLNLAPDEAVSLTTRISETFGLSTPALQAVLNDYLIQTTGKDDLEKYFGIEQPPQYLCPKTTHYSWPKGAAITGIGSTNMICVPALDTLLADCVKHRQAVYAIVVIMGTTEHGSVDPLSRILALRRKYQQQGLSFLIHADAAWGGYFRSMLVPNPGLTGSESHLDDPTFYATLPYADSVTLDPHKSGYTPYPAGALCYQDGRLRYMVTWNSPVIGFEDESLKMGVYGVEGSKPGAAPVSAWLGHEVIGLHSGGFGYLLGQSVFASTKKHYKMYCHWATMSLDHPDLLVVPFRMLPSEMGPAASADGVDEERRYIRDILLKRTREELANDPKACALMRQMGSDLVVNAFACNFRVGGVANKDIWEANDLNARIYNRLSFKSMSEKLDDQKVIIMSSKLSQEGYGKCLTKFKRRIGLSGQEDLFVLVNISVERNRLVPARRAFVLQGNGPISLVHMPYFGASSQRQQCILNGELSGVGLEAYIEAKRADPTATYEVFQVYDFQIDSRRALSLRGRLQRSASLKYRPLSSCYLDPTYPSKMPFYLYGTAQEMHIDHVLLRGPNAQLSAGDVTVELLEGDRPGFIAGLKDGLIAVADAIPELLMQPLSANRLNSFFHPGAELAVSIYHDLNPTQSQGPGLCDQLEDPIARGIITLGDDTFADAYMINAEAPTDPPTFRGYGPGGPRERLSSPERAKTWRDMWNEALAGQSPSTDSDSESSTSSPVSTPSDLESGDYSPSLSTVWSPTTSHFLGLVHLPIIHLTSNNSWHSPCVNIF